MIEMPDTPTKGWKLHDVTTHNVVCTNQKTESLAYVHKQYLINMLICICRNIGHLFFSVNMLILNIWECSFTMWN